jgi:hypothetical protein
MNGISRTTSSSGSSLKALTLSIVETNQNLASILKQLLLGHCGSVVNLFILRDLEGEPSPSCASSETVPDPSRIASKRSIIVETRKGAGTPMITIYKTLILQSYNQNIRIKKELGTTPTLMNPHPPNS